MSELPLSAALWFLPFVLPIAVWVAWSDMKFMLIPNKAVMALVLVWLVIGLVALPLTAWGWGWALLGIVLVIGFVANLAGLIGAGDAKFGAAMAPFLVGADLRFVTGLFAACLMGAFVSHRGARLVGPFRRAVPDWKSWTDPRFPMGLALAGTLVFYLVAVVSFS